MLVLTRTEVEALLDPDALLEALAGAHAELSAGRASLPPRVAAFAEQDGLLGAMPAYSPAAGLGCKLVSVFPHNADRPSHQALIALFDPATGTPVALMDGTHVTA
ncbi:MAG: ornithine cyclodeaminase family protein, partial [Gaiellaceae bacterium]